MTDTPDIEAPVYKILPGAEWREAQALGAFRGSGIDHEDGFIHFSTAAQMRETAARHFAGRDGLVLVAFDGAALARLGDAYRYEPSRGGDLFPHLYGEAPLDAVIAVHDLPRDEGGAHVFPAGA